MRPDKSTQPLDWWTAILRSMLHRQPLSGSEAAAILVFVFYIATGLPMPWWATGTVWLALWACVAYVAWHSTVTVKLHWLIKTALCLLTAGLVVLVGQEGVRNQYRQAHPLPAPSTQFAAPSVLLLPASGQLNLYNRGAEDIKMWGDKLAGTDRSMGEPRIIPKDAYYYFLSGQLQAWALSNIGKDGEKLLPFEVYLTDERGQRYTAKFDLLIKVHGGEMTVHTQQLGVTLSDWTKEPSVPDVTLRLVYAKTPALELVNQSDAVARDMKWMVTVWNLDSDSINALPIPTGEFDWLRPHQVSAPLDLFFNPLVEPLLKPGARLVGSASVICPDCSRGHTFIVSIVWGQGGWFGELKNMENGNPLLPKQFTKSGISKYAETLLSAVPQQSRIPIAEP